MLAERQWHQTLVRATAATGDSLRSRSIWQGAQEEGVVLDCSRERHISDDAAISTAT